MAHAVPTWLNGPFTVDDYHRMFDVGLLDPDARVELLDGLVVAVAQLNPRHAGCVTRLSRILFQACGDRATVRVQLPVIPDRHSEPQPDLAIVAFRADGYAAAHPGPGEVLLLIEVMDSSVDHDRRLKLPLYARAGIRELWLVDLVADAVDVYRGPSPDGYLVERRVRRGETLTPVFVEGVVLPVADILG